jgi:hypothetical protein
MMMKKLKRMAMLIALAVVALTGAANAARIGTPVSADIDVDTTWTKAGNPYYLTDKIYVNPGAALTIEEGVIVASYYADQANLAVRQGAKIFVLGTQEEPVIMTSAEDVATWTGSVVVRGTVALVEEPGKFAVDEIHVLGDPKTGYWRPTCQEWGSLALMGKGYLSHSEYADVNVTWTDEDGTVYTNTAYPSAMNRAQMEGLVKSGPTDTRGLYGGDDDDDDSGVIRYLSLRYGGKDVEPQKELNGLSCGAVGRGTDISYVDVMNNVDDGIEFWGGTVNISNVNIWNIGDDSFDIDQGWRGSLTTGLIVQGYCRVSTQQGGGIGDNAIEMDGAEESNAQPMTTARISNVTIVGQPSNRDATWTNGSDGGTAWRDNARVQFDKCLWIDLDDQLILFDNSDTDGGHGYDGTATNKNSGQKLRNNRPADGTLNWVEHWTTSFNQWKAGAYYPTAAQLDWTGDPQVLFDTLDDIYSYIPAGYELDKPLCNITNSVTYGDQINYSEYNALVADGADFAGNAIDVAELPIKNLVRGEQVNIFVTNRRFGMLPVEFINPLPTNEAAALGAGGFKGCNWLAGWTAADAYGFTDTSMNNTSADLNCDGRVDLSDLASFSAQWLQ